MNRLIVFTLLVLLPIAFSAPAESESDPAKSEKKGRSLGVPGMDRSISGVSGYPYYYHPQYLQYPVYYPGASIYPYYYPQYLQYPVVGSGVSLPGVNAGAAAGVSGVNGRVNAGVVPNVVYPRVVY